MRRAQREGYLVGPIDRNNYLDDIFDINTSLPDRQGRPPATPQSLRVVTRGGRGQASEIGLIRGIEGGGLHWG